MSEPSDLEITRKCAEAMGYKGEGISDHWGGMPVFASEIGVYDPLHDDAQCFALVKRFFLDVANIRNEYWAVTTGNFPSGGKVEWTRDADLNRAICLAVARMKGAEG